MNTIFKDILPKGALFLFLTKDILSLLFAQLVSRVAFVNATLHNARNVEYQKIVYFVQILEHCWLGVLVSANPLEDMWDYAALLPPAIVCVPGKPYPVNTFRITQVLLNAKRVTNWRPSRIEDAIAIVFTKTHSKRSVD